MHIKFYLKSLGVLTFLVIIQHTASFSLSPKAIQARQQFREIRFIENKGQWEKQVSFRASIPMGTLFLENNTLTYVLVDPYKNSCCHHPGKCEDNDTEGIEHQLINCHAFKMNFLGADQNVVPQGNSPFTEYYNYFIGNDPSAWASFVRLFREVAYPSLYPGTDLVLSTDKVHLKYEFRVKAGADPSLIRINYEGAERIYLDSGKLVIKTSVNDVIEQQPYAYQFIHGDTLKVPCRFHLAGNTISFELEEGYNTGFPLVIDPVVVAATYAGSSGSSTYGHSATYDNEGYVYTGGRSFGPGYPTTPGAFQLTHAGGVDISISKFSPDGTSLVWATYLGGSTQEFAQSLIVNDDHELFIYGSTNSANYPVTAGCFQSAKASGYDIILTHLNFSGSALLGSTFIGGNANDGFNSMDENYGDEYRGEVILDSQGNPCVASFSSSSNFPTTTGAFDQTHNGGQDGVVFKMSSSLTSLIWSTYLGGSGDDAAYGLKLNVVDMVYVAGGTASQNFPTTPWVLYPDYLGGTYDGFMCIFMPDISSMIACSYFGTPASDEIFFIQMDDENNVYVYGQTKGTIPVTPGCYGNPGSPQFIVKFDQTLNSVIYSTVFGNGTQAGILTPTAFLVDLCQNVYAAGWGITTNFPVSPDAIQSTTDGQDFYLLVLRKNAEELLHATFYGAIGWEHVDGGTSRFDKSGIIYQAVCEGSPNFPTTPGAYASYSTVSWELAVFKIDFQLSGPTAGFTATPGTSGCAPFTVYFHNTSINASDYTWDFNDGSPPSALVDPSHDFTVPGTYLISCIAIDSSSCFITDTAFLTITVLAPPLVDLGPDTLMCGENSLVLFAGNPDATYLWSNNTTAQTLEVTTPGLYWVEVNNGICSGRDTISVSFMSPPELGPDISVCEGVPVTITANLTGYQYLWSTGESSQAITVTANGIYTVFVTQGNCTLSDSLQVTFKPNPVVNMGPDRMICQGQTTVLDAGYPTAFHTWNTGALTQQINVFSSGSYMVTVTLNGCSGGDTIQVNVVPVPDVNLQGNRILCEGDTLTLDAGFPGFQYLWNTGETLQMINISDSGYYSVTVSAQGCSGSDTIHASLIVLRVDLGKDTLLCPGESILLDAGNPGCTYRWNTGDTVRAKSIKNSGLYWVRVSKYLCHASDTVHIDKMENIDLPGILNLCGLEFLTLDAGIEADSYEWSDGQNTPSIRITESGFYKLIAQMGHCTLTDSTLIIGKSGISTFYIPNTFTPNQDGKNETFSAQGTDIIYFNLKIFNRWGEFLYETNDIYAGWDGSYKGSIVPTGMYYYIIRYATECSFDQVFQKVGTVLLLK